MAEKAWKDMTPAEKRADRIEKWRNPGAPFVSAQAEADYKARVDRLIAAINLEKPDRVPVSMTAGWWPAARAGITPYEAMHDAARAAQAWVDFNLEFKLDAMVSPRPADHAGVGVRDPRLPAVLVAGPWSGQGCGLPVQREGVDAPRGVRPLDLGPHGLHATRLSAAHGGCVRRIQRSLLVLRLR